MSSVTRFPLLLLMISCPAWALDPALSPGGNFDLAHWKLTLPVDSNSTNTGNAVEISATQLAGGYVNALYFSTAPDGAMVFACPANGARTGNTSFPRCELREVMNASDDNINWSPGVGVNTLNAQCKVTQVPATGKVIIGQIHGFSGAARPLIKMQFQSSSIRCLCKSDPTKDADDVILTFANPGLNNLITYQISTAYPNLSVTVNGITQTANMLTKWSGETCYFKAGNYCQDNTGTSTNAARVLFYSLEVSHVTNTAPTAATLAATSISATSATLNGNVNASNNSTAVTFAYGTTTGYGTNVAGTPAAIAGNSVTPVSAVLTGLTAGTTYHFRVNGVSNAGITNGDDLSFTTLSTNGLALTSGTLSPVFSGGKTTYTYPRSHAAINNGETYQVEWSDNLAAGSWSNTGVTESLLGDNGTTQQVQATLPAGSGPKRFVRLKAMSL